MLETQVCITNKTGLHMRPGKLFSEEAKKYISDVHIIKGERKGNAKSVIQLLKIGISQGDTIMIRTAGTDEEKAMKHLVAFIKTLEE